MVEKVIYRFWNWSKPVLYFTINILEGGLGFRGRHSLVYAQPLAHIINVVLRNPYIDSDVDGSRGIILDRFAFELPDRALEHLGIEIKADSVDVAGLLATQEIPGAPQFKVERGDSKACAEVRELTDGGQAAPRYCCQALFRRYQQISIGPARRPSDTPSQLVQLGEPIGVGAIDYDGVCQRYIDSILYDGGA